MRITRVVQWPQVGGRSWIWYDDPELHHAIEHYRVSSEVRSITRLADNDPQAESGKGATDET
ncbi:hypothetical protein [Nesterenkonia ebinurensis]|uniref:hypothetical protein n=1 Tax=Nesterenkonia ebinurensis TaxID=2608252 RepID=UPI00123DBC2F|nr:hypothetical protein [Nesterenkonia ebinurensis]